MYLLNAHILRLSCHYQENVPARLYFTVWKDFSGHMFMIPRIQMQIERKKNKMVIILSDFTTFYWVKKNQKTHSHLFKYSTFGTVVQKKPKLKINQMQMHEQRLLHRCEDLEERKKTLQVT